MLRAVLVRKKGKVRNMNIDKEKKREIISEYKQRKTTGGVLKVTNTGSGKYWVKAEIDLESFENRFIFMKKTGTALQPKMQRDFNEYGAESFTLEILERVEKKEAESPGGFKDRLKRLEAAWLAKFDPEKSY